MKTRLFLLLTAVLILLPASASAIDATAGWTRSDVGLYEDGDGFVLGVRQNVLPGPGPVDLTVSMEYLVRAGSVPRIFSDPDAGPVRGNAEVKLHYLQPAVFAGCKLPLGGLSFRPYAGLSLAMKLSEEWTQPAGDTEGDYSYEDTDFLGHVGLTLGLARFHVDARYSFGFNEQLIDGTSPVAKAAPAAEEGVDAAEAGAKVSGFQVGVGLAF